MEKDTRLINIYLKIHNKRALTMHDLDYLAKYDPECFEKTCKNVVYNIPEAKPIMLPESLELSSEESEFSQESEARQADQLKLESNPAAELSEWQSIEKVLENIKHLEMQDYPMMDVDVDRVKSLLGNLYMELMFPHNDNYPFMLMTEDNNTPTFDKKA